MRDIITEREEETRAFGVQLATKLQPGSVVGLSGDLGAGKSVICRGIARGLGIQAPVTSPTFTIIKEYCSPDGVWLYHVDLYRMESDDEVVTADIEEILFEPSGITVIEWADKLQSLLRPEKAQAESGPTNKLENMFGFIEIRHLGADRRCITLPEKWAQWFENIETLTQPEKEQGG